MLGFGLFKVWAQMQLCYVKKNDLDLNKQLKLGEHGGLG